MSGENEGRCPLCQRHQRMETADGTVFWMEYGDDDRPRLCLDSRSQGGGLNVLCVRFCPICGRACETITYEEGNHGKEAEHPGEFREERGQTGTAEVPGR
ncbi:MAG: hypothetical protein Q4F81_03455 [Eubacteriales bacterium]|nr:hypothetical protein [Eubacteriales bacterium]